MISLPSKALLRVFSENNFQACIRPDKNHSRQRFPGVQRDCQQVQPELCSLREAPALSPSHPELTDSYTVHNLSSRPWCSPAHSTGEAGTKSGRDQQLAGQTVSGYLKKTDVENGNPTVWHQSKGSYSYTAGARHWGVSLEFSAAP